MASADSIYDHTKDRDIVDNGPQIRYDYMGPFENRQEALLTRAVRSMLMNNFNQLAQITARLQELSKEPAVT